MKNKIKEKYEIKKELTNDIIDTLDLYEYDTFKISNDTDLTISNLDFAQEIAQVKIIDKNNKITFYVDSVDYDKIINILNGQDVFYTQNLTNWYDIEKQAFKNLLDKYTLIDLLLIENYNEIGIVEYVTDNQFYIENDKIIIDED